MVEGRKDCEVKGMAREEEGGRREGGGREEGGREERGRRAA